MPMAAASRIGASRRAPRANERRRQRSLEPPSGDGCMETGRDLIMIASQEYSRMPGTSRFATEEDLGRLPQSRPLVIWSYFSFELFVRAIDSRPYLGGIG